MTDSKHKAGSFSRLGNWLPHDLEEVERWLQRLWKFVRENPQPLITPIAEFQEMVYTDPVLYANVQGMFAEAHLHKKRTTLKWEPEPINFEDFLNLLNGIMLTAPEAYQTGKGSNQQAAGMIGFPINALLDWPMGTSFGYDVFSNSMVNQQFKKILEHWSKFLVKPQSSYVLNANYTHKGEDVIGWLHPKAQEEMVSVAHGALGEGPNLVPADAKFIDVFKCSSHNLDENYGFKTWDDFFTREFIPEVRPISKGHDIIVNACESTPLEIKKNVARTDKFWLKDMPYSLENMLNWDEYTEQFVGGTVYQAFLSALSFHRWNSPVEGIVKKAYIVNGTYYLENIHQGFVNPHGADPSASNNSQKFLSAVATRALIFIEAKKPDIGLMCVMPIGMAEVSSCQLSVKPGDHVTMGQELGMFHFGGSTHCLFFKPDVDLEFDMYGQTPGLNAEHNIRVNTKLATVKKKK